MGRGLPTANASQQIPGRWRPKAEPAAARIRQDPQGSAKGPTKGSSKGSSGCRLGLVGGPSAGSSEGRSSPDPRVCQGLPQGPPRGPPRGPQGAVWGSSRVPFGARRRAVRGHFLSDFSILDRFLVKSALSPDFDQKCCLGVKSENSGLEPGSSLDPRVCQGLPQGPPRGPQGAVWGSSRSWRRDQKSRPRANF